MIHWLGTTQNHLSVTFPDPPRKNEPSFVKWIASYNQYLPLWDTTLYSLNCIFTCPFPLVLLEGHSLIRKTQICNAMLGSDNYYIEK